MLGVVTYYCADLSFCQHQGKVGFYSRHRAWMICQVALVAGVIVLAAEGFMFSRCHAVLVTS